MSPLIDAITRMMHLLFGRTPDEGGAEMQADNPVRRPTIVTAEQLIMLYDCSPALASAWIDHLDEAMRYYGIDSPARIRMFLAQIGHESGRLTSVVESLNYSADGLLATFGRHRISEDDAHWYGRLPGRPADQKSIANLVYGGYWGRRALGNTEPGDGWRYRGRGLIQITGRSNYALVSEALGHDFIRAPVDLELPHWAAMSAGWYWHTRGLNDYADDGDVLNATRVINGGTNGLSDRQMLFDRAAGVIA